MVSNDDPQEERCCDPLVMSAMETKSSVCQAFIIREPEQFKDAWIQDWAVSGEVQWLTA